MTYAQVAAQVAFEKAIDEKDTKALQEITDRPGRQSDPAGYAGRRRNWDSH